jgi:hypothetical protein
MLVKITTDCDYASTSFKGEARRGMGVTILVQKNTHPHPNPPLEGEGISLFITICDEIKSI